MQAFTTIQSLAAYLPISNIDTDVIFPARFLVHTEKTGLGRLAFRDWRYRPELGQAQILVTGANFGCGSSREQAPWALLDLGVRCVIAASFGEIFVANCLRNGLLPITLPGETVATLGALAQALEMFTVSLQDQTVACRGESHAFRIEPAARDALLNGWNETAVIVNTQREAIERFEAQQRVAMPWLYA